MPFRWVLFGGVLDAIGLAVSAACGAVLWRWFAVPVGLPPMTETQMMGLLLVAALFTHRAPRPGEPDLTTADVIRMGVDGVVSPLVLLCLGFCAHLIIG